MGFIRGALLVVACVALFILLFVGNILLTVSSSLKYENVKPELVSFLGDVLEEQFSIEEKLNQLLPAIELYCQVNQQYLFNYGGYTFTIPCNVAMEGSDALIESGVNALVDQYYYADYECDFWNCFGEEDVPLFLVSEKAQDYWQSKFYLVFFFSIALALLVFFLVQKKINFFFLVGALTIVSSLPLIKLEKIAPLFANAPGEMADYVPKIILMFFNQAQSVFIKVLIIGVMLVIIGIVLKLFHIGFIISNFFEKIKPQKFGKSKTKKVVNKEKNMKSIKKDKAIVLDKEIKSKSKGKVVKKKNKSK